MNLYRSSCEPARPLVRPVVSRQWGGMMVFGLLMWLMQNSSAFAGESIKADGFAPSGGSGNADFTQLSLEELATINVTTVSKKAEKLSEVPAAVTVITQDEIRRSGAETLADALRLAPGVQVARVDSGQWAVSVRGFNDTFAQKLLVMIDGRSVYTPLFSGTFWQAQDVLFEDLDRIEVVRGPGGSIWGANAVNGVINIVTKSAKETQGLLLTGGTGSDHLGQVGVRYGVQAGTNLFLRLYGKYDEWDEFQLADGSGDANDAWWKAQGGFRMDWEPSEENRFTLQGDLLGLRQNQNVPQVSVTPPYNSTRDARKDAENGNLLGRWTHQFAEDSDLVVQSYFERSHMETALVEERRSTFDLDIRHRFDWGNAHEIIWGGGYRLSCAEVRGSNEIQFSDPSRADQIFNVFIQDEITLVPDRLRFIPGTKLEHNDYTGFEIEPSVRLSWTPDARHTVWAAVSRAVRTPSQVEHDGRINLGTIPPSLTFPIPTLVSILGDSQYDSENLMAYELGGRIQPHRRLALEAATFLNVYDDLRSIRNELDFTTLPSGYAQALGTFENRAHGLTYGVELSATWQAAEWWRLQAAGTFLQSDLRMPLNDVTGERGRAFFASPEYQASLRSSMDLGRGVEFDAWLRFVDEIDAAGADNPAVPIDRRIPAYVTFDLRLAWRPSKRLELSVTGQNLAGTHREFNPTFVTTQQTEVGPAVFGKLTLRF